MKIRNSVKNRLIDSLPILFSMGPLVFIGVLLFIPLLVMILYTLWDNGVTVSAYTKFFTPLYGRVIGRSIFLATVSSTLALLIGYPVAYFLAFRKTGYKNVLIFLITVPFWTNLVIQVYAWFFILEKSGLINNILMQLGIISQPLALVYNMSAIVLLMVYCYLPFMTMPIYTTLQKFDLRLSEASMDLGATRWQTFWRIIWPLSLPGVRTGWLLVFVPAFGDFVIPSLVGGSRYLMVGSLISYYFLTAQDLISGAAFTVIAGLVLVVLIVIIQRLLRAKIEAY